ncbi:YwqG family protein [Lysobacter tyrosinilyticus]
MEILFYVIGIAAAGWFGAMVVKRLSPPPGSLIAPVSASTRTKRVDVSAETILAPYATALAKTQRPTLSITLEPMPGDDVLASKVGGRAYWRDGHDYPRGGNGQPLFLLAQIDFSQAPPIPGYPDSGLLQFFIANDDQYGADFGPNASLQKDFRVVYWPAPLAAPGPSTVPASPGETYLPMDPHKPRRMRFAAVNETMGAGDTGIATILGQDVYALAEEYAAHHGLPEDAVVDALYTHLARTGHKLGGYPYFTQEDPRRADDPRRLLLQLDTDDQMMWGDAGVANFFIDPDDLARRDFSRVMYNWDCH